MARDPASARGGGSPLAHAPARFIVMRDRDGVRVAVARHAVSVVSEMTDGGAVISLPGGRRVVVEESLDTVLQWLG